MITSEQQYHITQERIAGFEQSLRTLDAVPPSDPLDYQTSRTSITSILATLKRETAMWEADIHELVPDQPNSVDADMTIEQVYAMSDEEFAAASQRLALRVKQAQIANIDRQIAIQEARIADWRRQRAWLEREIAQLEAEASEPARRMTEPQHTAARRV
ncbi:MAG TPA: hypothetical protein VHB98_10445 [Chloroflexota bacterium]|nr:hypothetical protein [Chloroflexota bacterium]